jgi:DNA/RNA endonuclease YhcR with UshA esterase domain
MMTNRRWGLWILLGLVSVPVLLFAAPDHLFMSELVLFPNKAEYVTLTNPTDQTIQLGDYYLTDATDTANGKFYYNLPSETDFWSGTSSDFMARFPDISLGAGETLVLGLGRGSDYQDEYGVLPDLSLKDDMLNALDGVQTIPGRFNGYLDDVAETLVLFYWGGSSSTVKDVDYLLWGNLTHAVDKSDISGYAPDTPVSRQTYAAVHDVDQKMIHSDEGSEPDAGGNGITGHDEMGEPLDVTWDVVDKEESRPDVQTVQLTPASPTTEDSLTFKVTVTDESDALTVELITRFTGIRSTHEMTETTPDFYRIDLPPYDEAGELVYYVRAENAWGLKDSSLVQSVTISEPPDVLTIRDVRDNFDEYDGETVTLRGVMTIGSGKLRTDRLSAYFQDESDRGLNVYRATMIDLPRGTDVEITGELEEYQGIKEIVVSSYNIIGTAPLPEPLAISVENLKRDPEEYEGAFLELAGRISSRADNIGGGSNIDIDDGTGSVTIRIWNSTNILVNDAGQVVDDDLDSLLQVGHMITVRAVGGMWSGNAQLLAAYADDFEPWIEGDEWDEGVSLKIAPHPFVPQAGEVLQYTFGFPSGVRLVLQVYDMSGRHVATLFDEFKGLSREITRTWNGRDASGRILSPGHYIMHLEGTERTTGKVSADMAPFVIAVRF